MKSYFSVSSVNKYIVCLSTETLSMWARLGQQKVPAVDISMSLAAWRSVLGEWGGGAGARAAAGDGRPASDGSQGLGRR